MASTPMTTENRAALRSIRKLCRDVGATLEITIIGDSEVAELIAPDDHTWDGDLHAFIAPGMTFDRPDYVDMLARTQGGPVPCIDPDCDWCRPPETTSR